MDTRKLKELQFDAGRKQRPRRSIWAIFLLVIAVTGGTLFLAVPRESDKVRIFKREGATISQDETRLASASSGQPAGSAGATDADTDVILTVSGYIINGTRISPS